MRKINEMIDNHHKKVFNKFFENDRFTLETFIIDDDEKSQWTYEEYRKEFTAIMTYIVASPSNWTSMSRIKQKFELSHGFMKQLIYDFEYGLKLHPSLEGLQDVFFNFDEIN